MYLTMRSSAFRRPSPHPRLFASSRTRLGPLAPQRLHTSSPTLPYWRQIPRWRDTSVEDFLTYRWQVLRPLTLNILKTCNPLTNEGGKHGSGHQQTQCIP